MKKLLGLFAAAGLIACFSSGARADVSSVSTQVLVASVTFSASAVTGGITVSLKTHAGAAATKLSWNTSQIVLGAGGTDWKAAQERIEIKNDYTRSNAGVQIYTDNTEGSASPRYTDTPSATNQNPVGLRAVADPNGPGIPLCWRITPDVTTTYDITQNYTSDPDLKNTLYSNTLGASFPCFLWMKDKATVAIPTGNTTAFVAGEPYVTMWRQAAGIHIAGGNDEFVPDDNDTSYVYVGGKFKTASAPNSYQTSRLVVELFYQ